MTAPAVLPHLLLWLLLWVALAGLSALVVRAMIGVAVLDRPGPRKAHARPVPKGGGVGVVAAFLAGLAALHAFAGFSRVAEPYGLGVVVAAVVTAALRAV